MAHLPAREPMHGESPPFATNKVWALQ